MAFGKVLSGGCRRFRLLSKGRKAGERTVIAGGDASDEVWLQYGGPQRSYEVREMVLSGPGFDPSCAEPESPLQF